MEEKNINIYRQDIGIVIVHYHPKVDDITHTKLLLETYHGIAVDNTIENRGIAQAQNMGIKYVLERWPETQYIVFLDQDSRTDISYPDKISNIYQELQEHYRIGMLGPTLFEINSGEEYSSYFHNYEAIGNFIPRREIISSGSCIAVDVLKDVGLTDSELFIDYVDFDWCWRANAKGYICGTTRKLSIDHQVGKRQIHIGNYRIILSAPFRYYYSYRNYIWLLRRSYVPIQWKLTNGVKRVARFFYIPFVAEEGWQCWKYMCEGIIAGFRKQKNLKRYKK